MAMSIRNAEVERLAREVSSMTGGNLTETIEQALVAFRGDLCSAASERYERISRIAEAFSRLPDLDIRPEDELLGYGEIGV